MSDDAFRPAQMISERLRERIRTEVEAAAAAPKAMVGRRVAERRPLFAPKRLKRADGKVKEDRAARLVLPQ